MSEKCPMCGGPTRLVKTMDAADMSEDAPGFYVHRSTAQERIADLEDALRLLVGTIKAHDLESLSCNRDGNEFCDCLAKQVICVEAILKSEDVK